jgi:phosphohistidine phosphatase
MKRLILIRHADALPAQGVISDRDRCLSGQGWKELDVVRSKLHGHLQNIDLVLCSNAKRARQTLEGIKQLLSSSCEIFFEDNLYHASAATMLERIHEINGNCRGVMIIGHNPGMQELVQLFAGVKEWKNLGGQFATASIAIFTSDTSWKHIAPKTAAFHTFIRAEIQ